MSTSHTENPGLFQTEKTDDNKKEALPRSSRKEFPLRHHLERTTGAGERRSCEAKANDGAEDENSVTPPKVRSALCVPHREHCSAECLALSSVL